MSSPQEMLTFRQLEVLELLARGLTNREIAGALGISPATAKNHVSAVLAALDVTNRTEAAMALSELGSSGDAAAASAKGAAGDADAPEPVPGFGRRPAIAVLPFDNLSDDPAHVYFADGLVEDLTTQLASWRWFPVIARNSAFAYKGRPIDVKQAGRELGARYLIEGSSRRSGSRVRVNVQLIDGRSGEHLWAERYDRVVDDLFDLQDEIVAHVVSALEPTLISIERMRALRRPVSDLSAWELLQRGAHHLWRQHHSDVDEAEPLLRSALEIDPQLAAAWSTLSACLQLRLTWGLSADRDATLAEATDAARRAIDLDDADAAGFTQLGGALAVARNRAGAVTAFERALNLDPSSAQAAFGLGGLSMRRPHFAEAIEHFRRAIRLSPRDPLLHFFEGSLAMALSIEGRHEEALAHVERAIEVEPSKVFSFLPARIALLAHADDLERAAAERDAVMRGSPQFNETVARQILSRDVFEHLVAGFDRIGWKPYDEAPWRGPGGPRG